MIKLLHKQIDEINEAYADTVEITTCTFDKPISKEHFIWYLESKGITLAKPDSAFEPYYEIQNELRAPLSQCWSCIKITPFCD